MVSEMVSGFDVWSMFSKRKVVVSWGGRSGLESTTIVKPIPNSSLRVVSKKKNKKI